MAKLRQEKGSPSCDTKGGVVKGKTSAFKKAIITVKQGEQIDFYSNI